MEISTNNNMKDLRSRPPPRRKSCGECIKAKRRCDQRHSACFRCTKQTLDCRYLFSNPQVPNLAASITSSSNIDSVTSLGFKSTHVTPVSTYLPADPMLAEGIDLGLSGGEWDNYPSLISSTVLCTEIELNYLLPVVNADVWDYSEHQITEDIIHASASRLDYAKDVFKSAPSLMVLENGTPWSHPLLYKDYMPKSMLDAHATCALYIAKTDRNKHLIFRSIETRAKELLAAPKMVSPVENLARVHSLLLYQIIRLYDGNIRLRALGEEAMKDLEQDARALLNLLDDRSMSESLPMASATGPSIPPNHSTWIFQESCRRTFLVSYFFMAVYNIMKGQGCSENVFAATYPWTISAPLWEASCEFDFKIAWREKRKYIIRNLDFEEVLKDGRPEEIDDFAKVLLVATRGLSELKEWFYYKGGQLITQK